MPGGVSSPVRAFGSVDAGPVHAASADGAWVTDVDGNRYVDYVLGYGPMILGHAHPQVTAAIQQTAAQGTAFGLTGPRELVLAEKIMGALPAVERVRFVNSGTEAVMSALRVARGATGRQKIIKCTGCYHGHADAMLVAAGSGAATLGVPSSPGVSAGAASSTVLVPYNDVAALTAAFEAHQGDIAGFIVEPVAGNMGCVPPEPGYLASARSLCDQHGALLILDEVMTGFRVAWGGAQVREGITPDLVCLGKVMGGGMPCAAYGGRADLMSQVAPEGPIYQAGTLSGNPVAMAAGMAQLDILSQDGVYQALEQAGAQLEAGLRAAASAAGVSVQVPRVGSMLAVYFSDVPVRSYEQAAATRGGALFPVFFRTMLENGVMLAPSPYEAWFLSTAHGDAEIAHTLAAAEKAFAAVAEVLA